MSVHFYIELGAGISIIRTLTGSDRKQIRPQCNTGGDCIVADSMESLYAQRLTAMAFAACWVVVVLLVWSLHRQWWQLRAVRRTVWIVPLAMLVSVVSWGGFVRAGVQPLAILFAIISGFGLTAAFGLVATLPISGIALTIERIVAWTSRRKDSARKQPSTSDNNEPRVAVDQGRRRFVSIAAAVMPAVAVGAAGAGVIQSYGRTRFPNVPLVYPGLPKSLEGLRILHLSDLHLGYFVTLHDLERTMIDAEAQRADIVLVTGDVSDDLSILSDAIRMIGALKPRYGTFASLGNHEYYRGIDDVMRAFGAGPIPMLIDAATSVNIGASTLHIAAADDPARSGHFNNAGFLRRSVEHAIDAMPSEAFTLLMSHRPEGFDTAAEHGVDLTISGHYHGGIQFGLGGRAIIQGFAPDKYFWGHYSKGASQLYTSGGVGHWFPFRLNCPPEAPVYILRSSA